MIKQILGELITVWIVYKLAKKTVKDCLPIFIKAWRGTV